MKALEPGSWLAHLPEVGLPARAMLRVLYCRHEPATAGELLSLLRRWAWAESHTEPAVAVAVRVGLRTDRPSAAALAEAVFAEAVFAERRAERGR